MTEEKRTKNEIIRRYFVLLISLFLMGIGIAFTRHGGLGITPISSVAHIMSLRFTQYTFGTHLGIWNIIMFLAQVLLLGKALRKDQYLQIPLSFVSKYFTDAGVFIANRFPVDTYSFRIMSILIGTAILATAISISVVCDVVLSPGEGIVSAISKRTGFKFGNVKLVFDISCVVLSVILSLIFFNMKIEGTREGTLIAAVLTGLLVKFILPLIKDDLTNWFKAAD